MKIRYDAETDTLTIVFSDRKIHESDEIRAGVIADFDRDGAVVRFEILGASKVVDNARALADALAGRGFRIVAGGTDTHLFMISLVGRDITGKAGQIVLERAGITANSTHRNNATLMFWSMTQFERAIKRRLVSG